jgi:peptidoglycan hydrolase-like protein with peptidoglycan-binding domain
MSEHLTVQTQTATKPTSTPIARNVLQRQCACGQHTSAGGECEECKKKREGTLQRAAINPSPVHDVPPIVHEVLRSPGQPLDAAARAYMEPRFGYDFSSVRVHTDTKAAESARAVNALAYTVGRDVVFRTGRYAPATQAGQRLLAHELSHVMQQSDGGVTTPQTKLAISTPDDAGEREADHMADRVMSSSGDVTLHPNSRSASSRIVLQRTIGDGHDLQSPRFAGDVVLEACFDNERFLQFGSRGRAVEKVQQALIDAGFPLPVFGVDGIFESETQTAVRGFQRAHGLNPDGIVGPITMGALDAQFAGGPPAPGPAPAPPGPAPAPPGPAPAPPGPAPAPPGPAPAPPGPAPAPPGPAPAPPESITSQTVATSPGVRTRTTIGVGEAVNLTHAPGSAAWTTSVGPAPLSATNGDRVIFTAPDTFPAKTQRITVTAGAATKDFDVTAPTSVAMDREPGTGVLHKLNRPRSGIQTRVFLGPDSVNFSNRVRYRELDVAAVASPGVYSCNPGSGGHCNAGGGGAPCNDKGLINTVVAGMGTQSEFGDCACSGDCNQPPPFVAGRLTINIPYEYRVGAGAFHSITSVLQVHTLEPDLSTLTSSKAGANGTTTVAAGTVSLPGCPQCSVA